MPNKNIVRGPAAGGAPVDFFNAPNANGVYVDGSTGQLVLGTSTSGVAKKNILDDTIAGQSLVSPVVTGNAGTGLVVCKQALFTEDATSLTHTATFTIPAGALLLDILVVPVVLWTDSSAAITVGDANSATGWFQSTNLAATDLVLGERLQASQAVATDGSYGGAKEGAYVTTAGRFGQQSTNVIGGFCGTAYSVIGVVTVTTPSGTAGRTYMYVLWMIGQSVTPVLA